MRKSVRKAISVLCGMLALVTTSVAVSTLIRPSRPAGTSGPVHRESGELILPAAAHEGTDFGRRFIAGAFALLMFSLAVITLCALWLFPMPTLDRTLHGPLPVYPQPRLQTSPRQDFQRFLAEEMQQLNTYGWVDRQHGIVHVPIDVAMGEIVKRGIPGWPTPAPAQGAPKGPPP